MLQVRGIWDCRMQVLLMQVLLNEQSEFSSNCTSALADAPYKVFISSNCRSAKAELPINSLYY